MMFRNFACLAAFCVPLLAQPPVLTGKFILAEENSTSAILGLLTFDASGTVAGTQYIQASGVTQSTPVSGNYTLGADGSGQLSLTSQIATQDGLAPATPAVYEFLRAKSGGFVALRRDGSAATLADVLPAAGGSAFSGSFLLADEGVSSSGQSVAEIGVLTWKADGTLSGRLVVKQNSVSESKTVEGSYAADGSGFIQLKLSTPLAADEDGAVVLRATPYVFLATANQELIALRLDNSMPGLARIASLQ